MTTPKESLSAPSLLIVDDDEGMRRTLRRIFAAKGFRVMVTESGEDAVALALVDPPSAMLIDIKMGGMDGIETLRRVREHHPSVLAVFMTAYSTQVGVAEGAGALAVMHKPADLDRLLEVLIEAMAAAGIRH